jgi:hypothetical protein
MPASTREGCELSDLFLDEDGLELLEEASGIPGEAFPSQRPAHDQGYVRGPKAE